MPGESADGFPVQRAPAPPAPASPATAAPATAPPHTGEGSEAFYAAFWGGGFWSTPEPNPDERARADRILALVDQFAPRTAQPLRILDVGCGRGWLTNLLAARGNVLGVDPVQAGVDRAHELFPALEFRAVDTTRLVAEGLGATFDVAVSSEVIEHVPSEAKPAFLRSIRDLLAPGGLAVLTTPRGELRAWCARHGGAQQPIEHWLTEAELAGLARDAGFEVVAADRVFVPYYPHSVGAKIASAKAFRALLRVFPIAALRAWQRRQGIYQVIALRRPSRETA